MKDLPEYDEKKFNQIIKGYEDGKYYSAYISSATEKISKSGNNMIVLKLIVNADIPLTVRDFIVEKTQEQSGFGFYLKNIQKLLDAVGIEYRTDVLRNLSKFDEKECLVSLKQNGDFISIDDYKSLELTKPQSTYNKKTPSYSEDEISEIGEMENIY